MSKPLRVLLVEDSEDDALLEIRALKNGGYDPEYERVETAEAMRKSLQEKPWDVILCDYALPQFNGLAAIALLEEADIDIPLIIVSGAIGEETAVECMRFGARDYVMKGNLHRLASAVERELKEAESRVKRKQAEEALRESEANYRQLFDNSPTAIYQINFRTGKFLKANTVFCEYLGCSQEEITSLSPYDIMTKESQKLLLERLNKIASGDKVPENPEYEVIDKNGKRIWIQLSSKNIYDSEGLAGADVVAHDITDRKESVERMRKSLGAIVHAIAVTVEARDPYTAGHQRKVADLARAIATEMKLSADQIDGIRMASVIHDLGKISVPAEILSKPTKLTEIEFSLIKVHAQSGYDILKDIDFPWPIARMTLEHHERMNGSGYPHGLTGDKLLLESRILAVADVVEAMASHRPYRAGLGIDAALEEIKKNAGVLYDEKAVEVCLKLFRENIFCFESMIRQKST
jgi:PAS domain S-box-containing protein